MADKKKVIDLDNLDDSAVVVEETQAQDLSAGGLPIAQPRKGGVQEMYDKYKKQLFLFDISGSMGEGMIPDEIEAMYHWTDTVQEKFLKELRNHMRENFCNRHIQYFDPDNADLQKLIDVKMLEEIESQVRKQILAEIDEDDQNDAAIMKEVENDIKDTVANMDQQERDDSIFLLTYGCEPVIGLELKLYIIRQQLPQVYDIKLVATGVKPTSMGKMDVMKNAATSFITARFDKHPDAQVMAYAFDDYTELMTKDVTKKGLLAAVNGLYPRGGTNIFQALEIALKEFRRAPSAMTLHQIILVTDGETGEGQYIEKDLLPKMKQLGVVLDFIYVVGSGMWANNYKDSTEALKRICKETGGEFVQVDTPKDFNQKFLKAASRLMIPAKV